MAGSIFSAGFAYSSFQMDENHEGDEGNHEDHEIIIRDLRGSLFVIFVVEKPHSCDNRYSMSIIQLC